MRVPQSFYEYARKNVARSGATCSRIGMRFVDALFRWAGAGWSVERGNLLTDNRIVRRFVDIYLGPVLILFRNIVVGKDRFDGALRHAGVAIDAGVSVDL